nr:MAG TPA: hypothetical protein [Caudoviricetes sp.]
MANSFLGRVSEWENGNAACRENFLWVNRIRLMRYIFEPIQKYIYANRKL